MPGNLYLPSEVVDSIQDHVVDALEHAESGYLSAQEEEDTVTGELGGALRTRRRKSVLVTEGDQIGQWSWGITYSKFRSKPKNAPESVIGADGILEIRVGSPEREQRKSVLFQAKNSRRRDPRLVTQCIKMSVWREAAAVFNYTANGYWVYSIDDVIGADGSLSKTQNQVRLHDWMIDSFIGCKVGHPELWYERDQRKLYWYAASDVQSRRGTLVWADFRPKHHLKINVTPPSWEHQRATKIDLDKIPKSRLEFTAEDLFGLSMPFTLSELKKRRSELLHVYHSDRNQTLGVASQPILDARVFEINEAYEHLRAQIPAESKPKKRESRTLRAEPEGLAESQAVSIDELFSQNDLRERVKVKRS